MKKDYNRDVVSDMPVDASFTPPAEVKTQKRTTTTKTKINAIGTQKRTTTKTVTTTTKKASSSAKSKNDNAGTASEAKLRTKLKSASAEISDLEKLNESNIKAYRFKSKRNKVVIALLSVVLAITIITVATIVIIAKLKANCNFYIHGDANAVVYVDGQQLNEFRSPSNLQGNRIFKMDIELSIKSSGQYNITFVPKCYQKNVLMENTLIYEHNTELFKENADGSYSSIQPISGKQTIYLCGGVILDYYYQNTLNVDNFKLDFHIYIEEV